MSQSLPKRSYGRASRSRQGLYFRRLFQELLQRLRSVDCADLAVRLGGYDLGDSGKLLFGDE